MARFLRFHAPQIRLRLISSSAARAAQLRTDLPGADVVQASYFDRSSLENALTGIEGLMVLTTHPMEERKAMTNLVAAVRRCGTLQHMIRVVGLQPDYNPRRIQKSLKDFGMGLEIQHPISREVLDEADMPVTYLNIGASYMDNYLRTIPGLQEHGTLVWPNRVIPYIDPRELGEAAARILLSDDSRHIHQFYTLNNGEPGLSSEEVAGLMSEVFLRRIGFDGSREGFMKFFEPLIENQLVAPTLPCYLWDFFCYEHANATVWVPNMFLERTLGRKPNTMRAWLQEHRQVFFPDDFVQPSLSGSLVTRNGQPQTPASADTPSEVDGTWDCTVATPVGKEPHLLVMRRHADGSLTGEMTNTRNGIVMPLQNGRGTGNKLSWDLQLQKPFKVDLKVAVEVVGNSLSGHASARFIGKAAIQGTRRAA